MLMSSRIVPLSVRLEAQLKRAIAEFDRLNAEFNTEYPQLVRQPDDECAYTKLKRIVK